MVDRPAIGASAPVAPRRRRAQLTGRYFSISWQRPVSGEPVGPARAVPMMAVPKKLLPSAPLRNAVRRVVREAARAAGIAPMPASLLRLVALPECESPPAGARRPFDRRLPDGAFKRACRADADALLARMKQALAGGPR